MEIKIGNWYRLTSYPNSHWVPSMKKYLSRVVRVIGKWRSCYKIEEDASDRYGWLFKYEDFITEASAPEPSHISFKDILNGVKDGE